MIDDGYAVPNKTLWNEVAVVEDGAEVCYHVTVSEVRTDGSMWVRGRVSLTKLLKQATAKTPVLVPDSASKTQMVVQWFRQRRRSARPVVEPVAERTERLEWTPVWSVENQGHPFFIAYGELRSSRDLDCYTRRSLRLAAAEQSITLSDELFDTVLGPVEYQLWNEFTRSQL